LTTLVLRGPQTTGEIRARTERLVDADGTSIDDALDTLAARSPEPFALRLERHPGEREARWAHFLGGELDTAAMAPPDATGSITRLADTSTNVGDRDLAAEVDALRARLDRLEALLGVEPEPADDDRRPIAG